MTFSGVLEGPPVYSFLQAQTVVTPAAALDFNNDSIHCKCLNMAGIILFEGSVAVKLEGEPTTLILDTDKLVDIFKGAESAKVEYDDQILKVRVGRSNYKMVPLVKDAVLKPPARVNATTPAVFKVPSKPLLEALNSIMTFTKGEVHGVVLKGQEGVLTVVDDEGGASIDIDIEYKEAFEGRYYLDQLLPIIKWLKGYSEEIELKIGNYNPIFISANGFGYIVSPMSKKEM